jgi:hypothetical protein
MKARRGSGGIAHQHWVEVSVPPHASAAVALYPLNRMVDGSKIWSEHFQEEVKSLAPASKQILDPTGFSLVTILTTLSWLPF